jgi:hypothetical protein
MKVRKLNIKTLEKILESYKLVVGRPLTVDQETYRRALNTYNQLNDEYHRRLGKTPKYSSKYCPTFS